MPASRDERARNDGAGRPHADHADLLALEVGDGFDRAVFGHREAIDIGLVGGVEEFDLGALLPDDQHRLGAWQREMHIFGGRQLDAVARARQRH